MIKQEHGFSIVEGVLVSALIIAIGAAGYFAYSGHKSDKNSPTAAPKVSTTSENASESGFKTGEAKEFVLTFYNNYIGQFTAQNDETSLVAARKLVQEDTTAKFQQKYANANNYDAVICGQETPDGDVSIAGQSGVTPTQATFTVSMAYSGEGSQPTGAKATVIWQDGQYKIDAITCANL